MPKNRKATSRKTKMGLGHSKNNNQVELRFGKRKRVSESDRCCRAILNVAFLLLLFTSLPAQAQPTRIIAILYLHDLSSDKVDSNYITDSVYAAATKLPSQQYFVLSREKLITLIQTKKLEAGHDSNPAILGNAVGADIVFFGEIRTIEKEIEVTLKLQDVRSGQMLGIDRVKAQKLHTLAEQVREMAIRLISRLPVDSYEAQALKDSKDKIKEQVVLEFLTSPSHAKVYIDKQKVCDKTPCEYHLDTGSHKIKVKLPDYETKRQPIDIKEINWSLDSEEYSYLGMNDIEDGAFLISVGASPSGSKYKILSVLDGFDFSKVGPVLDVGFGYNVFSYRSNKRGKSWSISGFGPVVRTGRLFVQSQIHLLSFRHQSERQMTGWLPGLVNRVMIPLVIDREVGRWAHLIPAPTAGFDVWLNKDLEYDSSRYWLGLSWLGDIDFF